MLKMIKWVTVFDVDQMDLISKKENGFLFCFLISEIFFQKLNALD